MLGADAIKRFRQASI